MNLVLGLRHARKIMSSVLLLVTTTVNADQSGTEVVIKAIEIGEPIRVEIDPIEFTLSGIREQLHPVVTGFYADGRVQDLTGVALLTTSNEDVAVIKNGIVFPQSDGSATISVQAGGKEAKAQIRVVGQTEPQPVSFAYDTLAALSKQGCNSGACHGSPSGKGGFRLSLRAFDAKLDKYTLTREEYGRRTNPLDAESSLLLRKPLMKVVHGGGIQIHKTDLTYRVLRDWISEGCRVDDEDEPKCVRIEIIPGAGRVLMQPAHTQQFCVLAHFSDGTSRDVTEMAVYSTSDTEIANVTEGGLVVGQDRGETAVIVRYLEFIESSILTFVKDIDGYRWDNPPVNNEIDLLVHAKLQKLRYLPSDICTDEEFLRRVYLDVIGILPTIEESQQFLADSSSRKRSMLIDQLLDRSEYAKFWALKWGDLLRLTRGQVGSDGVYKYHRWIERAIRSNMPYDEFARQLLTASGSTLQNPPANFYRTASDMNDCVETISQIFMGARLQCAKCHNHPFERWSQDNYYGMGAYFNRIQRQKTNRADEQFIWTASSGDVTQPRTGEKMEPWVPVAGRIAEVDSIDLRNTFADWLTSAENPFFAKIEVNRIWSHLFGRGIVDPPDDFRESNPPANGPLLDWLAKDFAEHGFGRKHTIRRILNSRTYQRSHRPNDFNRDDIKYFSHYHPRLLSAEQLLDAICHVTGLPEPFDSLPPGTKATQLPAPDLVNHDFLKVFGQPERQTVCQCERTTDSSLAMAIQFLNGPLIHNKVRDSNNRFRQLAQAGKTDEQVITDLNLASLARMPTAEELESALAHIATKKTELAAENVTIQKELVEFKVSLVELHERARNELIAAKLKALPEALQADTKAALDTPVGNRDQIQEYLVEKLGPSLAVEDSDLQESLSEELQKKIEDVQATITKLTADHMDSEEMRMIGLEDVCWVLLNRNEFLFNH